MAIRTLVTMTDDIDGSTDDVVTTQFSVDGVEYEIDLAPHHVEALREALAPFVGAARKVGRKGARPAKARAAAPRTSEAAEIRAWAQEAGITISDRGRIPSDIVTQYRAATA